MSNEIKNIEELGNKLGINCDLMNYDTAEVIRAATPAEIKESREAAVHDGGVGAFIVEIEGKETTCYVEEL